MKTCLRFAINIVLLTVLLIQCSIPSAMGAENDELEDLFQNVATSDGALTEMYAEQLGNAFDSNPVLFLEKLSLELPSTQDLVLSLIYFDYGQTDSFDDKMDRLINENQLSNQARELADKLKSMGAPSQPTIPTETALIIVETTSEPASESLQTHNATLPASNNPGNDSGRKLHVSGTICFIFVTFMLLALLIALGCCIINPHKALRVVPLILIVAIILLCLIVVIVIFQIQYLLKCV